MANISIDNFQDPQLPFQNKGSKKDIFYFTSATPPIANLSGLESDSPTSVVGLTNPTALSIDEGLGSSISQFP